MLSKSILSGVRVLRSQAKRNFGVVAPLMKSSDPIQQLFLDKLKEYKSKAGDGKLVDATPEIEKEFKDELARVARQFGGAEGVNLAKFPDFNFADPKIDPITSSAEDK